MKLKRLLSLAGILAAILIFTGERLNAADIIAVGDAQAFAGGSDTVDVFVTTDSVYPGVQVTVSFDPAKFSYKDASLTFNANAWNAAWGNPEVAVDTSAGTVTVAFFSLSSLDAAVPRSTASLKLFSIVLDVAEGVSPGTETITPSGIFTSRTAAYEPVENPVTNLTSGSFEIQSGFNLSAGDAQASFGLSSPVSIYLSNMTDAVAVQFTLSFDSDQLVYADQVELNSAIWQGGAPAPVEVDASTPGVVKVAIYSVSTTAAINSSNDPQWIVKIYLKSASGAVESETNALTLTDGIAATRDSQTFEVTDNAALLTAGNFVLQGKNSLRVSTDAGAPLGGSDTVNVFLKNAETVVAAEAEVKFNAANFTVSESDVIVNKSIFSGAAANVNVEISITDSTIKVAAFPFSTDSIAPDALEKILFSVILHANSDATPGYDSLSVSGLVTTRDANFETAAVPIPSGTKGVFLVRSPFEYQIKSLTAAPQTTQKVDILFTNRDEVIAGEFVVKFSTSDLTFVDGSVTVNGAIWQGGAPTAEVLAGGDSVKIALYDLSGQKKILAGGSGQLLLSLNFTLKSSLVNGDTAWISVNNGLAAVKDENFEVQQIVATTEAGYIAVVQDITPPQAVTELAGVASETSITLSWLNPTATDLAKVTAVRKTTTGVESTVYTNTSPVAGAADGYVDEDVVAGIGYKYVVQAFDNSNNASEMDSTEFLYLTIPIPPVVLPDSVVIDTAIAGDARVTLKWTNPASKTGATVDKINIYRKAAGATDSSLVLDTTIVAAQMDSLVDTGLTNDVEYTYTLYVLDTDGDHSASASVKATPKAVVVPPVVVLPDPVIIGTPIAGDAKVTVKWTNPASKTGATVDKINIYRKAAGATDSTLVLNRTIVAAQMDSLVNTGLTNGVEYTYILYVLDSNGDRSAAASVKATPKAVVVPPVVVKDTLSVVSAGAMAGGEATVMIRLSNKGTENIAGISFKLNFVPAKVTVKSVALGADSAGLKLVGLDITAANTSGSLAISLVDFSFANSFVAGKTGNVLAVTFMVASSATGGEKVALTLSDASLSDAGGKDVPVGTKAGDITVASALLKLTSGEARRDSMVTLKTLLTSPVNVAGVSFTVMFDPSAFQIKSAVNGTSAAAMTAVGLADAITQANTSGSLAVSLVDFSFSNPIVAGTGLDIFGITFTVAAAADTGKTYSLSLDEASLSDANGQDIVVGAVGGSIKVLGVPPPPPGPNTDPTGDGVTDVADLFFYFSKPGPAALEELAAVVVKLLGEPLPATLLASAQDATASGQAAEGAALISLETNFEIVIARFTFSYDDAYQVSDVLLSQALAGKVFFKPMITSGRLVVDIISLTGLIPSELNSEIFSVAFRGVSQEQAGLHLQKVELVDRHGVITESEAAKVSAVKVLPKAFSLSQNSPNPFNPSTTIAYEIPQMDGAVRVVMAVYNVRGQKVITLVDELKDAGRYTVHWNGQSESGQRVTSGVYFYRINAGDYTAIRKMVILK